MAVAPYDPLAQAHQTSLRFWAADLQNGINPGAPGAIPGKPVTGSGAGQGGGGSGGLGQREEGWRRSERFQNAAGNAFVSGGSGWQAFSGGRSSRNLQHGAGEIDGRPTSPRIDQPKLELPQNATNAQKQSMAYDFAASFQEYARDALRSLGIGRRTV